MCIKTYDKRKIKSAAHAASGALRHMNQEAALVGQLSHPNVVCPFDKFETEGELHLVMEFASGGSLAEHMRKLMQASTQAQLHRNYSRSAHPARGRTHSHSNAQSPMPEPAVKTLFGQLVAGVSYLHRNNMCHRDIKLENCVVTSSGVVKLVDFGLATKDYLHFTVMTK